MSDHLTTDPNDPELGHGADTKPVPQNKKYLVLSEEERAKGFIRPVRTTYWHKKCRTTTMMSRAIAETYARNPKFYGATYCCACQMHIVLSEFLWVDPDGEITDQEVGS
jgi:hypothetical protein